MDRKWHKDCGGIVRWKLATDPTAHYERAGKCQKCGAFPIREEDIMFELEDGLIEHCNGKEWLISEPRFLDEVLDDG